ncbi:MAG TPA: glycosyltransferase [Bryobacteraceae bacterium]|nr:glycosyltransferase [Bryobacteraceae bacterium]
MKTFLKVLLRLLISLPLLLISPLLIILPFMALALADLFWAITGKRKRAPHDSQPSTKAVSVVIPSWNARDLLEKYLPHVLQALAGNPENEVIVVENGSTDGSAEFLREHFPSVRVLAQKKNLGFGGGSNAGFRAARNDIVVLLNNDMRPEPGFLQPLVDGFSDDEVFAVSCQIFFSDPRKTREETGLTQGWWENGSLRVRHRDDPAIRDLYPCFYGGGGSCAFDRRKFLELGGFDELLAPFYLEDTDLGYQAWKRGWKVLYQPRSIVYHEHRGTIGKRFSKSQIDIVIQKNILLFCWKNIHRWSWLTSHFALAWANACVSLVFGDSPERPNLAALARAAFQTPGAMRSRVRARQLATVSDMEAFRRPLGGYFRDRFITLRASQPLNVLFVSPYPICPPTHGGAVFMYQTTRELAHLSSLHLVILLDHDYERGPHAELERIAASVEYVSRLPEKPKEFGSILPFAIREFADADLAWLLHRQIYTRNIDIVQLEYNALAQYGMRFRRLACTLFEHDVYFQSVGRGIPKARGAIQKVKHTIEYLRALRYELKVLARFDRVQVCSADQKNCLASFLPQLASRLDDNLRAGIDTRLYDFRPAGREPRTMLFLGSFRHTPNQIALEWFVAHVLPRVLERCPEARLVVVGSDPPPRHSLPDLGEAIELRGFVEDIREPLSRYAIFVCPILSGSGMRVKLLEAFAAGIPVVSTAIGAEGLASEDSTVCELADTPEQFAQKILELFNDPARAARLANHAREFVVAHHDMAGMTKRLVDSYQALLASKRGTTLSTANRV